MSLDLFLGYKMGLGKDILYRTTFLSCIHVFPCICLLVKKQCCALVDFKKAFYTVWRIGLWQTLIKNKICGKMFGVILNLYTDIKSCVKNWDLQSNCFPCEIGVRQGEKLSPCLFALYLNDLEEYLSENYINHLEFLNENCIQYIGMYLKLFLLLYADDKVIFVESPADLQLLLIFLKNIAQNGSSLLMFQKPK